MTEVVRDTVGMIKTVSLHEAVPTCNGDAANHATVDPPLNGQHDVEADFDEEQVEVLPDDMSLEDMEDPDKLLAENLNEMMKDKKEGEDTGGETLLDDSMEVSELTGEADDEKSQTVMDSSVDVIKNANAKAVNGHSVPHGSSCDPDTDLSQVDMSDFVCRTDTNESSDCARDSALSSRKREISSDGEVSDIKRSRLTDLITKVDPEEAPLVITDDEDDAVTETLQSGLEAKATTLSVNNNNNQAHLDVLSSVELIRLVNGRFQKLVCGPPKTDFTVIKRQLDAMTVSHAMWESRLDRLGQLIETLKSQRITACTAKANALKPKNVQNVPTISGSPGTRCGIASNNPPAPRHHEHTSPPRHPAQLTQMKTEGGVTVREMLNNKRSNGHPVAEKALSNQTQSGGDCIDLTDDDDVAITSVVPGNISPQQVVRLPPDLDLDKVTQPDKSVLRPGNILIPVGKALIRIPGNDTRARMVDKTAMPTNAQIIPTLESSKVKRASFVTPTQSGKRKVAKKSAGAQRPQIQNDVYKHNVLNKRLPPPLFDKPQDNRPGLKRPPPSPILNLEEAGNGIVLSWNMPVGLSYAEIQCYQLFSYSNTTDDTGASCVWKQVGQVNALPLPMACTLTHFKKDNTFYFAVRAVDVHGRVGLYSQPNTIQLGA